MDFALYWLSDNGVETCKWRATDSSLSFIGTAQAGLTRAWDNEGHNVLTGVLAVGDLLADLNSAADECLVFLGGLRTLEGLTVEARAEVARLRMLSVGQSVCDAVYKTIQRYNESFTCG